MRAPAQVKELDTGRREGRRRAAVRVVRPDERQLLLRHREGDAEAFAGLVAEYRAPIYSYLARCGVDPADRDDLFQEVFVRIHRSASSYRAERPVHPWIFTIVSNTLRSYLRRRRVRRLVFSERGAEAGDADPPDPAPDGERSTEARQAAAFVLEDLRKLRLVQREVVLLACVERLALKEVAGVLGIPVNTVKTHLRRARLALAAALARRHGRSEVER